MGQIFDFSKPQSLMGEMGALTPTFTVSVGCVQSVVFACSCCVTSHHKPRGLQQCTLTISQCPWVKSPGTASRVLRSESEIKAEAVVPYEAQGLLPSSHGCWQKSVLVGLRPSALEGCLQDHITANFPHSFTQDNRVTTRSSLLAQFYIKQTVTRVTANHL